MAIPQYTAPKSVLEDIGDGSEVYEENRSRDEYQNRRFNRKVQADLDEPIVRPKKEVGVKESTRKRPKRWDVTPDQYEQRKRLELAVESVKKEDTVQVYQAGETPQELVEIEPPIEGLEGFTYDDSKTFGVLLDLQAIPEPKRTNEENKEVLALTTLLEVKNGTQIVRKRAIRSIGQVAQAQGPKLLLSKTLSVFNDTSINDLQKHLLMRVISKILFVAKGKIKPFTANIIQAIGPMLTEPDFSVRMEARELVGHLTAVVGMVTMISSLRANLDDHDEYVRNYISRVFAIVANSVGLVQFMPFLRAVVKSKQWTARHTGVKIVQQLAVLMGGGNGGAILPFLDQLTQVLGPGLTDNHDKVSKISALTVATLAETVRPYGFDVFEPVLAAIWQGLQNRRGGSLAAFVRALGAIIPLACHNEVHAEYANYYTRELLKVMTREFNTSNDEMKKTLLSLLATLPLTRKLVGKNFVNQLYKPFVKNFWTRFAAADTRATVTMISEATKEMGHRLDPLEMLNLIVPFMKHKNQFLRRMAVETVGKLVRAYPSDLIGMDSELEYRLVDGVVYAFQEQETPNRVFVDGFAAVIIALGTRLRPHIDPVISTLLYNLQHQDPEIRQQAATVIGRVASVIITCYNTPTMMFKLVLILYESLGEVHPEVLASIIEALYGCITALSDGDLSKLTNPSVNEILPTLTPILKNRHDLVQEACIKLVGLIAQRQSDTINAKEWMRICFELLDMLKANKRRVRVAANDTFGHIAKTIGPSDVIVMLLNNLRMQERQLRVCTAVAIGIVADTCAPFTVLPAIMNEYRIPDKNVQNGVLKALSFMMEYLSGPVTKDYLFSLVPLLENALSNRDPVHRQTAGTVVKHMALNCVGLINADYLEVFIHFINMVIPNVFEQSPHVIVRILEALDALRLVVGNGVFLNYVWAGLWHPARKVRGAYWRLYDSAYVNNSDAMVPYFRPVIPEAKVEELDLII